MPLRKTESLLQASKEVALEANAVYGNYTVMPHHQNTG
jgi:hypothetical protein